MRLPLRAIASDRHNAFVLRDADGELIATISNKLTDQKGIATRLAESANACDSISRGLAGTTDPVAAEAHRRATNAIGRHALALGFALSPTLVYQVLNLKSDESHGEYETIEQARGCVRFDKLTHYAIWRGHMDGSEFFGEQRVECCDPYEGDDDRVKQGLGQPNASER